MPWLAWDSSTRRSNIIRRLSNGLPDHVQAHNNFGIALANRGRLDEAIVQFQQGLKIKPDDAGLHGNLANALSAWAGTLRRWRIIRRR